MNRYQLITIFIFFTSSALFSQKTVKHTVVEGESVYVIAKKYGVTESDIYELNPKSKGTLLQLKTILLIPNKRKTAEDKKKKTVPKNSDTPEFHTAESGESLYKIAVKYGISLEKIIEMNPNLNPESIQIGDKITILASKKNIVIEKPVVAPISMENMTKAEFLIAKASEYIGTRYRGGGTTSAGFDCSGLIFTSFKNIDMTLPRSSGSMAVGAGVRIEREQAQKGDLIFFTTNGRGNINHVGMITEVLGDEIKFIHSSVHSGVVISSTKEPYYAKRFIQINRVLTE
jgi:LysM repeat protein